MKRRILGVPAPITCLAVVMALLGGSASAAVASPANWSTSGAMRQQGTLTIYLNGGTPKTCTVNMPGTMFAPGGFLPSFSTLTSCTGGLLSFFPVESASLDAGSYSLGVGNGGYSPSQYSPYGGHFLQDTFRVPFTNGAGATPSRITFSNTVIGHQDVPAGVITATGTLNVTTGSGGLVTLS